MSTSESTVNHNLSPPPTNRVWTPYTASTKTSVTGYAMQKLLTKPLGNKSE
jgi:hypothetical protein